MASFIANLPDAVVVSGSSYSNVVALFDDALTLTIASPASLTGTITIEIELTATGTNFVTLQSAGTDINLPAGKGTLLNAVGWKQMRLASNASEGSARTFQITKTFPV